MRALSTALLLALLGVSAVADGQRSPAPTGGVLTITLTKSEDIADAAAVRAALRKIAEAAAPCNATARDANSCACSRKVELKRLRLAYDAAVARHSDWRAENAVVSYVDPGTRNSVAIALPVVKRQLVSCAQ